MSTVLGEIVLRLFKVQIIEYLSSIYDYFNIILTCRSMKFEYYSNHNDKKFLNLIINNNLDFIFKTDLKFMRYNIFVSLCEKLGLVLSGSIMLKAITGNQWALEGDVNQSINQYLSVSDVDTYIDQNYDPNNFTPDSNVLLSKQIKDHNLKYDFGDVVFKCFCCLSFLIKVTSQTIFHFLVNEIETKFRNEIFVVHSAWFVILDLEFSVSACIDKFPKLCYIILTDIIYMFRHLIIKNEPYKINTDDSDNVVDGDTFGGCFYNNNPMIVIDLIDIVSTSKVSIIIPCHACEYVFNLYDFKFLGISKDYKQLPNFQLSYNNTIPFILNRNKNISYQQDQNYVEPKLNVMLNNHYDDTNCPVFQLEVNLSKKIEDIVIPLTISNFHMSRRIYMTRIKNNCTVAYVRMLKYYKRGFYTFTTANINNSEFLFDIDNLDQYDFIRKHILNIVLKNAYNEQLSSYQLQQLADLKFFVR